MKRHSLSFHRHLKVPFLVIVRDFHTMSVSLAPFKADSKLVVDSNAVLAFAVSGEGFQAVSREGTKIT